MSTLVVAVALPAAKPAAANAITRTWTGVVDCFGNVKSTGLKVYKNEKVSVSASGLCYFYSGRPSNRTPGEGLHSRIGTTDFTYGAPVAKTATTWGTLAFFFGDSLYSDNSGYGYTVTVTITSPTSHNCGGSTNLSRAQARSLASSFGLTGDNYWRFVNDPCNSVTFVAGTTSKYIADDPRGSAPIASAGGTIYAPCKIATYTFPILAAFLGSYREVARYDMKTDFCYHNSKVFKRSGGAPNPAVVQNIRLTVLGEAFGMEHVSTSPPLAGYRTWNNQPDGRFFTQLSTTWKTAELPIVSWFTADRAYRTSTQVVYGNGDSRGYFGNYVS
ncbi:hypothetical protein [Micromonospora nigra]|uniref:hypothetical protein n=1 Tax=Micromonospora nigra TaxID=145857 RepID=UPI000B85AD7B|nr:hypothetical protein [Micromonospora nigra]